MGYRSHQTRTCGLHVHVNRDSLGNSLSHQEETIAKILFFVENHWNELLRFSRRTQEQMEHWAARYGRKDNPKEQMEHVKKRYLGRYTCVNLQNDATIEFRLFRGTLRYNTLIATLQLVDQICCAALLYSDEEMAELTWSEFVSHLSNLPELVQYLKERQLYVNDIVTGEEGTVMCCLFGLLDYKGHLSLKERQKILKELSAECEARGTDATGIAYFDHQHLTIQKAPKPAHKMRFRLSRQARFIMGHTRMTTQGNEKFNYNNHPFSGKAGRVSFALAHNGVLYNDKLLRFSYTLPETEIETDSYVAAQLLERYGSIDFASLRSMAEELEGTFTFTVLDQGSNLYFVRGNNPMCILHFPQEGFYLYASTDEILLLALTKLRLDKKVFDSIPIQQGDLLRIGSDGRIARSRFDDSRIRRTFRSCWDWEDDWLSPYCGQEADFPEEDYLEELKEMAAYFGVNEKAVELLRKEGFSYTEIEDMFYEPGLLDVCLAEAGGGYLLAETY
jgi:predicted glutamine amidotransferase